MQRLAKTGKVVRVRDVVLGPGDRKVIGWQQWEMTWDPENDPYATP
jgi:hypothetical protein